MNNPSQPPVTRPRAGLIVFATVAILTGTAGFVWFKWNHPAEASHPALPSVRPLNSSLPSPKKAAALLRDLKGEALQKAARESFDALVKARPDENGSTDSIAMRAYLDSLREYLLALPAEQALVLIRNSIQSGLDFNTKLGFGLGQDHYLTSAPTFRTFLMDLVAKIDKVTAGQMARAILDDNNASPDEWAVSMRNLAWSSESQTTRNLLKEKASQMIRNGQWMEQPTVGMLQAFDVFVHTEAIERTPELMQLARTPNRQDLAHAAFLTMDRLTQVKPAETLTQILDNPEGFAGREQMVSNFFARADVRDAPQRTAVERYLLDPKRTPEELSAFAGVYPSENYIESYNLLTREPFRTGADVRQRDLAALKVLEQEWLNDPRFASRQETLRKIQSRLREFLGAR